MVSFENYIRKNKSNQNDKASRLAEEYQTDLKRISDEFNNHYKIGSVISIKHNSSNYVRYGFVNSTAAFDKINSYYMDYPMKYIDEACCEFEFREINYRGAANANVLRINLKHYEIQLIDKETVYNYLKHQSEERIKSAREQIKLSQSNIRNEMKNKNSLKKILDKTFSETFS